MREQDRESMKASRKRHNEERFHLFCKDSGSSSRLKSVLPSSKENIPSFAIEDFTHFLKKSLSKTAVYQSIWWVSLKIRKFKDCEKFWSRLFAKSWSKSRTHFFHKNVRNFADGNKNFFGQKHGQHSTSFATLVWSILKVVKAPVRSLQSYEAFSKHEILHWPAFLRIIWVLLNFNRTVNSKKIKYV